MGTPALIHIHCNKWIRRQCWLIWFPGFFSCSFLQKRWGSYLYINYTFYIKTFSLRNRLVFAYHSFGFQVMFLCFYFSQVLVFRISVTFFNVFFQVCFCLLHSTLPTTSNHLQKILMVFVQLKQATRHGSSNVPLIWFSTLAS